MGLMYLWKPEKNDLLKLERNISFEDVIQAIQIGGYRGSYEYKGTKKIHNGHKIFIIEINGDLWKVPAEIRGKFILLRTIYPA